MINTTPYTGKMRLCFEKFPHYTCGNDILNKVHLDLGFTKLVSRLRKTGVNNGKVSLINTFTGGHIGVHEWWVIKATTPSASENPTLYTPPLPTDEVLFHGRLEDAFLSPSGVYMGQVDEGWWYYTSLLKVCDAYPHGVAIKVHDPSLPPIGDNIVSYYGFSHRGGSPFKIGDSLFDKDWEPSEDEVLLYEKYFIKHLDKWDPSISLSSFAVGYIPYNKRGSTLIQNWDQALLSAINLSKHLG